MLYFYRNTRCCKCIETPDVVVKIEEVIKDTNALNCIGFVWNDLASFF